MSSFDSMQSLFLRHFPTLHSLKKSRVVYEIDAKCVKRNEQQKENRNQTQQCKQQR